MPRPKPPEPSKPRCVRMTDTDWALFKAAGGVDWLRKRLNSASLRVRYLGAERNRRIVVDSSTMSVKQLAEKYNLTRSTINKILKLWR